MKFFYSNHFCPVTNSISHINGFFLNVISYSLLQLIGAEWLIPLNFGLKFKNKINIEHRLILTYKKRIDKRIFIWLNLIIFVQSFLIYPCFIEITILYIFWRKRRPQEAYGSLNQIREGNNDCYFQTESNRYICGFNKEKK